MRAGPGAADARCAAGEADRAAMVSRSRSWKNRRGRRRGHQIAETAVGFAADRLVQRHLPAAGHHRQRRRRWDGDGHPVPRWTGPPRGLGGRAASAAGSHRLPVAGPSQTSGGDGDLLWRAVASPDVACQSVAVNTDGGPITASWACSSAGQSASLTTTRSQVRALSRPPAKHRQANAPDHRPDRAAQPRNPPPGPRW